MVGLVEKIESAEDSSVELSTTSKVIPFSPPKLDNLLQSDRFCDNCSIPPDFHQNANPAYCWIGINSLLGDSVETVETVRENFRDLSVDNFVDSVDSID